MLLNYRLLYLSSISQFGYRSFEIIRVTTENVLFTFHLSIDEETHVENVSEYKNLKQTWKTLFHS